MRALAVAITLGLGGLAACWTDAVPAPSVAPTCAAAATHVQQLLGPLEPVHDLVLQRCVEDHWPRDVLDCMIAESDTDRRHCKRLLPPLARAALARTLAVGTVDAAPDVCAVYDRVTARLESCTRLSGSQRALIAQQHNRMVMSRVLSDSPAEAAAGCRDALAAIDPSVLAQCGIR